MADVDSVDTEEEEKAPIMAVIFVLLIIVFLLAVGTSIVLYTDSFLLKMLGVPFCLIGSIGCGFWISSMR